ncbi:SIR2 family protein [Bacteroides acidifaciens]|uniref:SIR2 family protein n=1 Tax=Bacteroides acidifaciens TaxID=85831 RepID=UPI002558157B|nr:SIR2 family protein [Bacteroides acidifaciens]
MQTSQQTTRIRHLLNNKSLSFIIGAGFSRNMSDRFVDWSGLLKPIVKEMYNIDDDNDVWHKIEEIGYLGIAEEYVRRKGYHEAIDVYIEQHTPIIIRKGNSGELNETDDTEYIVMQNNEEVDIADITCHKLLFDLDVKNIFTFNYDNCLDVIGNTDEADKLLYSIRQVQTELYFLEQIRFESNNYNPENLSTTGKTSFGQESIAATNSSISTTDFGTFIDRLKSKFPALNILREPFTDNTAFHDKIEDEIARKKVERSNLQRQRESCYQLISSAGMLSLTDRKKNIFKLHGTIRLREESEYGFDGDSHCNYIITANDYADYPIRHEPFVDYMKISLLKGSFCIMGFSGDDPNFLSWMSWVKEVIDKNPEIKTELSQKNSARFFYIHSGGNPLSKDKRLLLKNHYIEYVELSKMFNGNSHKERIAQFLDYLSPKTTHLRKIKKSWNNINKLLSLQYSNAKWDVSSFYGDIEFIYNSHNINRIPIQNSLDNLNRDHILRVLHRKFNPKWGLASEQELKLAFSALRDELLLPSHYFEVEEYKNLLQKSQNPLFDDLAYLLQKEYALCNRNLTYSGPSFGPFIQIWKNLYGFNFKEAKKLLDAWKPSNDSPVDKVRKLMFKAILSEDVYEQIPQLTNRDLYVSVQDYINVLELLPLISRRYRTLKDGGMNNIFDFSDEIDQIQTDCPYIKTADYIVNKLIEKVKGYRKPIPFGNKSQSFTFGHSNPEFVASFKILSIFFELCRPLYISNIILFPAEKWNLVCEYLYRDYPYPCLFYSLQYRDSKLTTSICQKILYCDDLKDELPRIVKSLFSALRQKECPENYRQSIMFALPILSIGVDATHWNKDFISFFNKLKPYDLKTRKYDDRNYTHEDFYKLISFGLTWTSDKEFKIKVLSDILNTRENIGNWENSLIINALHSLNEEDLLSSQYIDNIRQGILWLCENGNKPAQICVILNLIKLIDEETVQECLENLPTSLIESDCTLMKAIPNYIQLNSPLISRIKGVILKSRFLWSNGISNGCVSVGCSFLDIADISKIIDFTEDELLHIWDKMKLSLFQIQKEYNTRSANESLFFLSHFDGILDEMKLFVENNSFKAITKEEYDRVHDIIIKLRISVSSNSSHNISELLIEDHTDNAISMLVNVKPEKRFMEFQSEYILLANKIVLKQSQYLNSCMKHFSWVVGTYSDMVPRVIFKPTLEYILIAYTPYFNGDLDWDIAYARKDEFEKGLMRIYSIFRNWGGENSFWASYKPRFVNI